MASNGPATPGRVCKSVQHCEGPKRSGHDHAPHCGTSPPIVVCEEHPEIRLPASSYLSASPHQTWLLMLLRPP
eukprot:366845-Amphidinium_carterae.1